MHPFLRTAPVLDRAAEKLSWPCLVGPMAEFQNRFNFYRVVERPGTVGSVAVHGCRPPWYRKYISRTLISIQDVSKSLFLLN
jgi:hypothetical protein